MKILFPDNWMQEIIPFIDKQYDFILLGSMSQMRQLTGEEDLSKLIAYNWDHYSFIDMKNRGDWMKFHKLCKKAKEVWIPTYAHGSYYRADQQVKSHVTNIACVLPHEWDIKNIKDKEYVLFSSRKDTYKRFPFFAEACDLAGIPYKTTHPEETSREEYIETLQGCRFYVQASLDESLGGLSLMEAVWNQKPVLMSNSILGGKELYGDSINYFQWDSKGDLVHKLQVLWENPTFNPVSKERISRYTPKGVGEAINKRLCELATLQQAGL